MADLNDRASRRCAHPACPGYPFMASDAPHPPETCTDAGRLTARARAEIDGIRQPERAFIRFVDDRTRHFEGALTGRRYRKATAEALVAKGVLEAFGAYAVDGHDNLTDRFGIAYRLTDLGREVCRLLDITRARAVLAKCPWCIHPRHASLCTGRNGGTAHPCPCFQDSLHAPEAIEAARLLAEADHG